MEHFIERVGLIQCLGPLLEAGFEDLESLIRVPELTVAEKEELNMPEDDFQALVAQLPVLDASEERAALNAAFEKRLQRGAKKGGATDVVDAQVRRTSNEAQELPDLTEPMEHFIERVGLMRCLGPLLEAGFEDLEALIRVPELTVAEKEELNMPEDDFQALVAQLPVLDAAQESAALNAAFQKRLHPDAKASSSSGPAASYLIGSEGIGAPAAPAPPVVDYPRNPAEELAKIKADLAKREQEERRRPAVRQPAGPTPAGPGGRVPSLKGQSWTEALASSSPSGPAAMRPSPSSPRAPALPDLTESTERFLERVGLMQFLGPLLEAGFEDLEALIRVPELTVAEKEELAMPEDDYRALVAQIPVLDASEEQAALKAAFAKRLQRSGKASASSSSSRPVASRPSPRAPELIVPEEPVRPKPKPKAHPPPTASAFASAAAEEAARLRASAEAVRARRRPSVPERVVEPAARAAGVTDVVKAQVRRTWKELQNIGMEPLERVLYKHTFDLFPPEAPVLGKRFGRVVFVLGESVSGDRDITKFIGKLKTMGARHINYHTDEEHWPILWEALHRTLGELLGDSYTDEVQEAWSKMYYYVSKVMIEGMREAQEFQALRGPPPPPHVPPVTAEQAIQRYQHILQGLTGEGQVSQSSMS